MNGGMISTRYARALLQYAINEKAEDGVYIEMKKVATSFADEHKLKMAMENPMINTSDKLKLMETVVGGKASKHFIQFVELVLKNKRESHFHRIALSYRDLYCKLKYINLGRFITAMPVNKSIMDKLKTLLYQFKTGTFELETSVDPTIKGGFILYVDTYRYDASVASQLKRIKKDLVTKSA